MPVVPFTRAATGATSGKAKLPPGPPPAEPFALMAAAQMHAEGRLIAPNVEDRRDQTAKERDNEMVDDQQLPPSEPFDPNKNYMMGREMGAKDLDEQSITQVISRGLKK